MTPRSKRKLAFKKPPDRGYVHWDEATLHKLVQSPAEPLQSQFRIDHGMLLNLLERTKEVTPRSYRALVALDRRQSRARRDQSAAAQARQGAVRRAAAC